jgi:alpha-tubulin suppressor-like RCC1 family protein
MKQNTFPFIPSSVDLKNLGSATTLEKQNEGQYIGRSILKHGIAWSWGTGAAGQIGNNSNNSPNTPTPSSNPVGIIFTKVYRGRISGSSTAAQCQVALDQFSYAWAWGNGGSWSQIGDNTIQNRSFPVSVVGGKQWLQIIASDTINIGLDTLSYAWAWGTNGLTGDLGDNTVANRSSPTSVVGGKQWLQILSSGINGNASSFTVGLDNFSYAWAWGTGANGVLGNNLVANQSSPVSVVGGRQFKSIYIAESNVFALDSNSYAYAWGINTVGQLGINTVTSQSSPVSVIGGRQWKAFSVSRASSTCHVMALDSNSYAYAWGNNNTGGLGDNTIANRSSPISVPGGKQWLKVFPDQSNTFGIDINNRPYAWGINSNGQLGDNTIANRSSPISVNLLSTLDISSSTATGATDANPLYFLIDGTLWTCGLNTSNELGDGTSTSKSSPVMVGNIPIPTRIF